MFRLLTFGSISRRRFLFSLAIIAAILCLKFPALAQSQEQSASSAPLNQGETQLGVQNPDQSDQTQKDAGKHKDDRMFYVMPNYLTVDNEAEVKPISWKEKFDITAKGAFDPYEFTIVGVVAGIRQADDSDPAFGQGMAGYGKRYGTAFADQVDANIMVGAVFPTILKTDPRYFRLGRGSFVRRFGYAISRIFVTRTDAGGNFFNISEFAGNGVAIGISNLYYPASDRSFSSNLSGWGTQMGIDAFGNGLKEFWPDVHKFLMRRKHSKSNQ